MKNKENQNIPVQNMTITNIKESSIQCITIKILNKFR